MPQSVPAGDPLCTLVGESTLVPKSVAQAAFTGPARTSDVRQKTMRTKYRTAS